MPVAFHYKKDGEVISLQEGREAFTRYYNSLGRIDTDKENPMWSIFEWAICTKGTLDKIIESLTNAEGLDDLKKVAELLKENGYETDAWR